MHLSRVVDSWRWVQFFFRHVCVYRWTPYLNGAMFRCMSERTIIQGRETTPEDIELVKRMIVDNPSWSRFRISRELCKRWNWRNASGSLKDMACRSFLLKLERRGLATLPPRRSIPATGRRKRAFPPVAYDTSPIASPLRELLPLEIDAAGKKRDELELFNFFLARYHYLGYGRPVGENMKYLVRDRRGRMLGCVLFGAAAWKTAPRDDYIGWDRQTRERRLGYVANNHRFLILPWVRVPHLASHLLSRVAKRISADWMEKYNHPVYLLETFVDRSRFRGTCYRAASWIHVGDTAGRGKCDRDHTASVPVKSIWLYPLDRMFRARLYA